jgi:hypothetical protein
VARYRLLMLLGWAVLLGGPLVAWRAARPDQGAAVAYGASTGSWVAAVAVGLPSALAAALLLLNGALRARGRHRRGELALGAPDRALVATSVVAGWTCAGISGVALLGAMVFGGPLGIIGGFGLLMVLFAFVGHGRGVAPGYRAQGGRRRPRADEV